MAWTGPVATLASRDRSGEINAVIETPKGSRNKFKYDPASDLFRLSHVLPAGASFPFSFGFIPKTLGADGDPLDVIVLLDEPVPVGCLVAVRLIGVMEAEQSSGGAVASRTTGCWRSPWNAASTATSAASRTSTGGFWMSSRTSSRRTTRFAAGRSECRGGGVRGTRRRR